MLRSGLPFFGSWILGFFVPFLFMVASLIALLNLAVNIVYGQRVFQYFGDLTHFSSLLTVAGLRACGPSNRAVMENVDFIYNDPLTIDDFVALLEASTLAARRPVEDRECLRSMLEHANLTVCARRQGKLIGIARSVTDFSYCCYLSDLAVDREFQGQGIGRELIRLTRSRLGPRCKLLLLSAPAAVDYYSKLGFRRHPEAWYLDADDRPEEPPPRCPESGSR